MQLITRIEAVIKKEWEMEKKEGKLLFNRLSDRMFESIENNLSLERRQALLIKLGIDTVLNVIPKLILTVIIAMLLNILGPVMVFVVSFLALRGFAYGRHLKSDLLCTILTMIVFVGAPYLVFQTDGVPLSIRITISVLLTGAVWLLAPADTKLNPIKSDNLRKKLKKQAVLVAVILCLSQIWVSNLIGTVIMISMISAVILLIPYERRKSNEE